jgi:hypothetical protein
MAAPAVSAPVARALVALVVCGSVAEQLVSAGAGHHFPHDLNDAYPVLPVVYAQLQHGQLLAALGVLPAPGGWYNLALAGWLQLFGRSGPVFTAATIPGTTLLLLAVAGLARRWWGPWAAVAATALAAQIPLLAFLGAAGWIHMPETTLVAGGAWLLAADPGLARWRSVVGLALCGALAITLRDSGLLWIGLLGLAAAASRARREPGGGRRWGPRAAFVVLPWVLAAAIVLPSLRRYVGGKIDVRARYARVVEAPWEQVWMHLGAVSATLVGIGLVALAFARLRPAAPPRETRPAAPAGASRLRRLLLAGWLLVPLGLLAVFRSGLDNFPLFYVALALVAGAGLGTRPGLALLAVVGWVGATGARFLGDVTAPAAPPAEGRVEALLDATCPDRGVTPCLVIVDQGLFHPRSEEPGLLEAFLLREDHLRVAPLVERHPPGPPAPPAALATWSCGARDAAWIDRFPTREAELTALITRWQLAPAWIGEAEGCTFSWLTPGGELPRPDRAPGSGTISPPAAPMGTTPAQEPTLPAG